jgi:NADH dehydrogenase
VRPDLSLAGHPEVFAIGDIAASPTENERPLPQVAQPAIQGGVHAAAQIVALIEGRPTEPFHYHDKGSMATIGRNQAVAEFPSGLRFHGRIGWLMWLGLHLVYLIGFRNRLAVLVNWSWNYLTYDHSARTLVESSAPRNRSEPGRGGA